MFEFSPLFRQVGIATVVSVAGAAAGKGVLVPKATAPASLCVQYPKGMAFRRVRGVNNLNPAGIQSLVAWKMRNVWCAGTQCPLPTCVQS